MKERNSEMRPKRRMGEESEKRESAVGRGEGLDRNSRAVSAKDKHISPTKQCVSVSMSYTKQTGIKLPSVRLRTALFA